MMTKQQQNNDKDDNNDKGNNDNNGNNNDSNNDSNNDNEMTTTDFMVMGSGASQINCCKQNIPFIGNMELWRKTQP
jgi:hypothetical protein